jgi:hypothetical protein
MEETVKRPGVFIEIISVVLKIRKLFCIKSLLALLSSAVFTNLYLRELITLRMQSAMSTGWGNEEQQVCQELLVRALDRVSLQMLIETESSSIIVP